MNRSCLKIDMEDFSILTVRQNHTLSVVGRLDDGLAWKEHIAHEVLNRNLQGRLAGWKVQDAKIRQ
jgi:hypothetical protein